MTLNFIGIGLHDEKDISVKGLEAVRSCNKVYLESYTSRLQISTEKLSAFYGKKIIEADRDMVEQKAEETILKDAEHEDTAFLVIGDVFGATTHTDLFLRAKEKNIHCRVIHNTSILNAVSDTGLELYKFGKTTSLPYHTASYKPATAYDVLKQNHAQGLHTLILLDIKKEEDKYMSVNEAIALMRSIEDERQEGFFTDKTLCVGCARIGADDATIIAGSAQELADANFGRPLHCLIVPGNLHFIEEDMLKLWKTI